jgi:hypothetical protein
MITIIKGSYSEDTITSLLEKLNMRKKFRAKKYLGSIGNISCPAGEQKKFRKEWE